MMGGANKGKASACQLLSSLNVHAADDLSAFQLLSKTHA